jgi:hypothetical protein
MAIWGEEKGSAADIADLSSYFAKAKMKEIIYGCSGNQFGIGSCP